MDVERGRERERERERETEKDEKSLRKLSLENFSLSLSF